MPDLRYVVVALGRDWSLPTYRQAQSFTRDLRKRGIPARLSFVALGAASARFSQRGGTDD